MYIEIFRVFFFCVKAHRRTIKTRKKTLSLLLYITLQFGFEKRPVLGLSRVTYPLKSGETEECLKLLKTALRS